VPDSAAAAVTTSVATATATATTPAVNAVDSVSASHSPVSAGSDSAAALQTAPGSASVTSSGGGEPPLSAEEESCAKVKDAVSSVQQLAVKAASGAGSANMKAASNAVVLCGSVKVVDSSRSSVTLRSGTMQQCAVSGSAAAAATTPTVGALAVNTAETVPAASNSPISASTDKAAAVAVAVAAAAAAATAAKATLQTLTAQGSASVTSSTGGESLLSAEEESCAKVEETVSSEEAVSCRVQQQAVKAVSAAGCASLKAASNAVVLGGGSGADSASSVSLGTVATASTAEAQLQAQVSHICTRHDCVRYFIVSVLLAAAIVSAHAAYISSALILTHYCLPATTSLSLYLQQQRRLQGVTRVHIKYDGCDANALLLPVTLSVQTAAPSVLRLSRPALVATAAVVAMMLRTFTVSDSNDSKDDSYKPARTALAGPTRVSQMSSERAAAAAACSASALTATVRVDGAAGTTAMAQPAIAAVDTEVLSASASEQRTVQQAQLSAMSDSSDESDTEEALPLSTQAGGSSSGAAAAAAAAAPVDISPAAAAAAANASNSNRNSAVQLDDEEYDESVQAQLTHFRLSTDRQHYTEKHRTIFADDALKEWVVNRHGALRENLAKLQLWCEQRHMSSEYREELAQLSWQVFVEQRVISDKKAVADIMIGFARSAAAGVAANGTATGVPLHSLDNRLLDDLHDLQNLTDEGHWSQEARVKQSKAAVRKYTAVRLASTETELLTKVATLQMCVTDGLIDQQDDAHAARGAALTAAAVEAAGTAAATAAAATAAADAEASQ
jgi:hypothetical protein